MTCFILTDTWFGGECGVYSGLSASGGGNPPLMTSLPPQTNMEKLPTMAGVRVHVNGKLVKVSLYTNCLHFFLMFYVIREAFLFQKLMDLCCISQERYQDCYFTSIIALFWADANFCAICWGCA